jgi:hypothetical protein
MAGAFGVLLLAATFLPWYARPLDCAAPPCRREALSAWGAFAAIDVLLLVAALFGLAAAVTTAVYRAPAVPVAVASLTALVGTVAAIAVLLRAAFPPDADVRLSGLWLGVIGAVGVAVAGWLAVRDEGHGVWPGRDSAERAWPVEVLDLPAPAPTGKAERR